MRGHGLDRHQIDRPPFLGLLRQQLSEDLDTDVLNLGLWGSRGALFKVTPTSHGYTVVAKGSPAHFVQCLKHEAEVYQCLHSIQGIHVPVCLGDLDLTCPYPFEGIVDLVHMMFLRFGGRFIQRHINAENRSHLIQKARDSMQAIHALGILHRDAMPRNLLWSAEMDQVMVVDFERASIVQSRPALGHVSPNQERKSGSKREGSCRMFATELAHLTTELKACNNLCG